MQCQAEQQQEGEQYYPGHRQTAQVPIPGDQPAGADPQEVLLHHRTPLGVPDRRQTRGTMEAGK